MFKQYNHFSPSVNSRNFSLLVKKKLHLLGESKLDFEKYCNKILSEIFIYHFIINAMKIIFKKNIFH